MTMHFETKAVICVLLLSFRKKAKKEDMGSSVNSVKDCLKVSFIKYMKTYVRILPPKNPLQ